MSLQAANLYANVSVAGAGQSVRDLGAVSGAVDKTQAKFSVLGIKAQGYGKGVRQIAGGLVKLGEAAAVGFVAATAVSAKFAADFQSNMELIRTQAGRSQTEVDNMTKGVQDMVHAVGTSPNELAKGLYHIESVGLQGAQALDVLKASALGAKLGLADMDSVTNALTAVLFSGVKGAKSASDAMAVLDGIVGVGNMHLQDLTDSFKSGILGTSATFGIDLRSLGAAIATLTDAGVPANIAATRLNMTISHMAAPVPQAIKQLKALGLGQFDLANDLRKPDGIFVALSDLHTALAKAGDIGKDGLLTPQGTAALTKIFGGSRFGATAMQLITAMDRIPPKYDLIAKRSTTFAANVQATMATASFHWGQFIADLENDAISFGQGVLPGLISGLDKLDQFAVDHRKDAVTLGKDVGKALTDIGDALDHIDWSRFQAGFEMAKNVAELALSVLKLVPPEVAVAFAGLVGIDKLSGGLLGKGAGNIVGTAMGQFLGRGSAANPMWVVTEGGFGGGIGGAGGGAKGLLGTITSFLPAAFAAAAAAALYTQVRMPQEAANKQAETDLTGTTSTFAGGASLTDINKSLAGLDSYMEHLAGNSFSVEGLAYKLNFDGVKDSLLAQRKILTDEQTYLSRASAEGWGIQRTKDTSPLTIAGTSIATLGAAIGTSLTPGQRPLTPAQVHKIIEDDRKARGLSDNLGPSTSINPRLKFLAGSASGKDDVAVANALALGFERGATPLFRNTALIPQAIKALQADARTLHGKDRAAINADITRLKAELAAAQRAAATKTAAAARAAGILDAAAIRDKDMSVNVSIPAATVRLVVGGAVLANALIPYVSRQKLRNS
jgi:TP901 family phage tail tape measure protein